MLGAGQVQRFITGDQFDDFRITFHQFALGKGERAGETDIETDRFQCVDAHQAQIQLAFQGAQGNGKGFTVRGMRPFTEHMIFIGHTDKIIIIAGNIFRAFDDLFVCHDIIEYHRRIIHDITDNMCVRTRVNGFRERPGFHPGFQLRNGDQRQQRHVRAAALNGIQQGLVFQVADEYMLFVIRQGIVVNAIAGYVHFFRTPEEGELFFNQ